ncbi:MFS transporter [Bradyrhizobium neotropicale]|uniref:MFS transporter n=1 Tax=Bradyrhizobium neotropicale TaxID=1497615 RepID=UPI003D3184AC
MLPPRRAAAIATFNICQTRSAELAGCQAGDAREASGRVIRKRSDSDAARGFPILRLIACVFLPFAAGYYLSYVFRTINTVISGQLSSELGLDAANLGLLTSVYFLVFAGVQIPVGTLLDRFGPRRVQSVLLLIAGCGAALFGAATGLVELLIARALIGLGVSGAALSGMKAIVTWFPRERVALINGYMITLGALGAVTATTPAEWALEYTGWRQLFEILALATFAAALLIFWAVPEAMRPQETRLSPLKLRAIYTDRRFWRIAPLSASCVGSAWSLQALWAAPWLKDVEGLTRESLITQLFIMALGVCAGALLLGTLADRLRRRGIGSEGLFVAVTVLFMGAELALVFRVPLPSQLSWLVISVVGAATVLSYAIIAEYFPREFAARANAGLNVVHFGWCFVVQYGTGLILEQWSTQNGHPAIAYQVAFACAVAVQCLALAWYLIPWLRSLGRRVANRSRRDRTIDPCSFEILMPPADAAVFRPHEGDEW